MTTAPTATRPSIKRYYDAKKANEDLREYDSDISVDLMRQPGFYAYYNALLVKAEAQYDRLKASIDTTEAYLYGEIRREAATRGEKMTEGQIKAAVAIEPKMQTLVRMAREAKQEVGYLKGTCIAFVQRKDTLQQLAYMMREELKGSDPTVMQHARKENHDARMARLAKSFPIIDEDYEV